MDRGDGSQFGEVFDGLGSRAQPLLGLVGERVGVVEIGVAGPHQLKGRQAGALQLGEAVEVAVTHAAATDDGEGQFCGHINPFCVQYLNIRR